MLNISVQTGRFTRDPELRSTPSGRAVVSFTMAVDRDYVEKESGKRTSDFPDFVAWGSTAEFIKKHFFKGSLATVEGRLSTRNYEDKNGSKRKATEVTVANIYFDDRKPSQSSPEDEEPPFPPDDEQP